MILIIKQRIPLHLFILLMTALVLFSSTPVASIVLEGTLSQESTLSSETSRDLFLEPVVVVESSPAEVSLDIPEIPNTRTVWKELIRSADQSIIMGLYYYTSRNNTALYEIGKLLRERADKGVNVEVVSDTVFFDQYPDELKELAGHPNADVRILGLDERTGGVMHAKYFVVDDESYYVGSANFSWKALKHNRELGLAGTDPEQAEQITDVFEIDWQLAGPDSPDHQKVTNDPNPSYSDNLSADTPPWISRGTFTAVTASPPKLKPERIRSDRGTLVELIQSAQNEIFVDVFQYGLTSPYSESNLDELDFALRRAAQRGVRVNVLVSDWSLEEPQRSHLESLDAMPKITVRAIGFPTHSSGYLSYARTSHPKMLLVDGQYAWVGSANWQPGYFSQSRNLGLVTNHSTATKDLKKFFLTAWTSAHAQKLSKGEKQEPSVPYHR